MIAIALCGVSLVSCNILQAHEPGVLGASKGLSHQLP